MTAINAPGEHRPGHARVKRARFGLIRRHLAAVSVLLLISLPALWALHGLLPLLL